MKYDIEQIGQRVKALRTKKGYTQEQLAERVQIGTEVIGKLERGKRGTGVENYIVIAEELETTLDYLLLGRENFNIETIELLNTVPKDKWEAVKNILKSVIANI